MKWRVPGVASSKSPVDDISASIPEWREKAKLACVLNPVLWLAVHGVSLNEYLRKLDELESQCVKVRQHFEQVEEVKACQEGRGQEHV